MSLNLPNLAKWQGRQWIAALSVLLLFTLTPLGWIQWRQYHLLDDIAANQVDSIMWQAYQLEREAGRLRNRLVNVDTAGEEVDPWGLTERYEVFLSRIDLLTNIPRRDLLASTKEYEEAFALIGEFSRRADPVFAEPQQLLTDPVLRRQLVEQLNAMEIPLSELTRASNRAVARFLDERNNQLRQQSFLVVGLATAQILIMLLFVGLLVRHIRRQQRQFTELQSLSQALELARDEAEAANRGKSIFLANMSHEIRTPFQGLLGMLNLLNDASLNSQQRDYLQTAQDSALHLLGVLNDILDVSTMESGTMKLSVAPVNLPTVVQEVDGLMQVAARDKGLSLNMYAAPDLPQWVMADATRLRQIMFNLINNAIKFTSKGGVIAELTVGTNGASSVLFSVRDTGMGMDKETVQRLFTRFYQADNSLRRRIGGTGLGLEISRNLAHMMGGDIAVQSTPGQGSVFTVSLELDETGAPTAESTTSSTLGLGRTLRVLVAEDHPINLKYMSILLDKMGHEAVFCENGQEALQLLERESFDVVLLDYHMPVLDGLATTEAIRASTGPQADIKIILVTADVVNDTRKRAREVGVDEFASKPLQSEDLQRAMARCGLLDTGTSPLASITGTLHTGHAPLSSYDLPARLPELVQPSSTYINGESFKEILSMMPSDALGELLSTVFEPPEGSVHTLVQAIATSDRSAIGHHAHRLKGVSMLMGFQALVTISSRIEHLAMQTEEPISEDLVQQLVSDAGETQQAIHRFEKSEPVL
ncbi:MAG: ATP-binding protein [Hydrogenophaga sp.]